MMQVTVSNRMEGLAATLVDRLEQERREADGDPFHTPVILVSTPSIRTYLGFEIARRTGVAANIRFRYWREFLREPVAGKPLPVEVPERGAVQSVLVNLLAESSGPLDAPVFAPVRRYLAAAGPDPDAHDRRRFQLAGQLARLFEEYALNRPDMMGAWLEGRTVHQDPGGRDLEAWQQALWRELFGPDGRLERASASRDAALVPASALVDVFAGDRSVALPPRIHLFGFSYVAETYHRILRALAAGTTLHVYALHPVDDTFEPRDALPLATLWGSAGAENLALLSRGAPARDRRFVDPSRSPPTLLTTLARDILERTGPPPGRCAHAPDPSIRVLECPDIRREVEIIASEIWSLVRRDPDLRFNEIAVILNRKDLGAYQAHIASVFPETHAIPFTLIDIEGGRGSRIVEVVEQLLALPLGRFTRPELLRLLTHPAVAARFPDADPDDWIRWCERTAVFHGVDHDDHRDTYIEKDLFNWDQGLRRVALGTMLTGEASGDDRLYTGGGRSLKPEEVPPSAVPSAAAFVHLTRSLIADARWAAGRRLPLERWARFFHGYVTAYVRPAAESADEDERQIALCLAAIAGLAAIDLEGTPVSFRIAADFARARLADLSGRRGRHLADGVVVSSFRPMRAIPFKAIFVAGLGEGCFPSAEVRNPLDLRAFRREPGDVDPREQDRHLFLETLLSARERLTLSYVARDAATGDTLQPSVVLQELLDVLARRYVGEDGIKAIRVRHRLRRYDEFYFGEAGTEAEAEPLSYLPAAHRETVARALGSDLRSYCHERGIEVPDLGALSGEARARLTGPLDLCPIETGAEATAWPAPETLEVSLSVLRRFLVCPLQGWARFVLGIRDDEDDDAIAAEDEAFTAGRLEETVLLREVLVEARRDPATPIEAVYERHALRAEAEGKAPTGFFGTIATAAHRAVLAQWTVNLASIGEAAGGLGRVHFGRAEEHARVDALEEPLAFEVPRPGPDAVGDGSHTVKVSLVGSTGLVTPDRATVVVPVVRNNERIGDFVGGYVDHLALAAAGLDSPASRRIAVIPAVELKPKNHVKVFPPIDTAAARRALSVLLEDLLGGPHDYLLPVDWVKAVVTRNAAIATATPAKIEETSSKYGPIQDLDRFERPSEEVGLAMIERRFKHFPWRGG